MKCSVSNILLYCHHIITDKLMLTAVFDVLAVEAVSSIVGFNSLSKFSTVLQNLLMGQFI